VIFFIIEKGKLTVEKRRAEIVNLERVFMPKVYRIENSDMRGPYDVLGLQFFNRAHDVPTHPGPADDFPDWWRQTGNCPNWRRHKFAFTSMEQLRNWFNSEELAALELKGFRIVEIETTTILEQSDKQCIFIDER